MRQYATFLIPTICLTFHLSSNTGFVNILLAASDKLLPVFPGTRLHFRLHFDMHSAFEQMLSSFTALMVGLALLISLLAAIHRNSMKTRKMITRKNTVSALSAVLTIICPDFAMAHETELTPIVVTANPIIDRVRIDGFSSTSAVVTESQLHDQNAFDLATALRRTPGVQISRYNPVGAFGGDQGGAVFIRGMGVSRPGSEIKTYIDGIPFYMGV